MKDILILYYSGVGNTKRIAYYISDNLSLKNDVEIYSIEELKDYNIINEYKALVIGFPTIHTSPAKPILEFLDKLLPLNNPKAAYVFTTCGLYSANTIRIFDKLCVKKNIIPIINRSYKCPATDGMLLAPFMKYWFSYKNNLWEQITADCFEFVKHLKGQPKAVIPKIKLYSILNYPNKVLGHKFPLKVYMHKEKCVNCGLCVSNCPVRAIKMNDNLVKINRALCINCYRCIHNCPKKALSLSKKSTPYKTWSDLYS